MYRYCCLITLKLVAYGRHLDGLMRYESGPQEGIGPTVLVSSLSCDGKSAVSGGCSHLKSRCPECPDSSLTGPQLALTRMPPGHHSSVVISRVELLIWQLVFSRATIRKEPGRSCMVPPDGTWSHSASLLERYLSYKPQSPNQVRVKSHRYMF